MPRDRENRRAVEEEIASTLRVSSYLDEVQRAMETGQDIQPGYVPDLSPGQTASRNRGGGSALSNEGQSLFSIDYRTNDYLSSIAAESLGIDVNSTESAPGPMTKTGSNEMGFGQEQRQGQPPRRVLSDNQIVAIKKYPALVEILGTNLGDGIAKEILANLNKLVAVKIASNSQKINPLAKRCIADKQNLKQYFVGSDESWICVVTASGPFRGDEAFHYNKDKDRVSILREENDDYLHVTDEFNVVHEYREKQ